MKSYILLFSLTIVTSSCTNGWNESGDKTFHKACIDEAKTWAGPQQMKPEVYCNCVITKVKEKYPNEDEALKNIGSLSNDIDLQACRDSVVR